VFDVIGSIVISLSRCCLSNDEGPGPLNIFFLEPPLVAFRPSVQCGHVGVYVQSVIYILLGLLTTLAVMVASAALLDTLSHQIIEISQFGYSSYVSIQQFRYEYAQYRYVRTSLYSCSQS